MSSGAGASGDCLSQVHLQGSVGWDGGWRRLVAKSVANSYFAYATMQVDAMGTGDKRVIGLHIAVGNDEL